jgi:hypothetical protein
MRSESDIVTEFMDGLAPEFKNAILAYECYACQARRDRHPMLGAPLFKPPSSNEVFDFQGLHTYIGSGSLNGQTHHVGGVTASTEMLAAKRHAGVHTPVIACKTTIANQQMAYAA